MLLILPLQEQKKKIAEKIIEFETRIIKRINANQEVIHQAINILTIELAKDPYFRYYFYTSGAYPFMMNETKYNEIYNIFKT